MNVSEKTYPWYCLAKGDELQQGDILEGCPIFLPPSNLTLNSLEANFKWTRRNVIVMSQTCDMVKGREKIKEALLCFVWNLSDHTEGHLFTPKGREEARRGRLPGHHILNECQLAGAEREFRIVDFHNISTLPLDFCREFAGKSENRVRLLPPYREHLSQALPVFSCGLVYLLISLHSDNFASDN